MKGARPTSRDIARLAEVSQATVSRALRNSPLVRPETRERIESIARQLSYRTDRRAAGLRTRRSNTLALLLFEESSDDGQINPFFLSMLGHITRATARAVSTCWCPSSSCPTTGTRNTSTATAPTG